MTNETAPDSAAVEALAEAMHAAHYRRTCLGGTSVEPGRGCIETRDLAEAALAAIARGEVPGVTLAADRAGTDGATLIAGERRRQVEAEGWTPEHDREHGSSRLLRAAEAYESGDVARWPWDAEWWRPKDALSNLIRAGALYQAAADVSPGFDGAARAGVERCAEKIDGILARASALTTAHQSGIPREAVEHGIDIHWGNQSIGCICGDPASEEDVEALAAHLLAAHPATDQPEVRDA